MVNFDGIMNDNFSSQHQAVYKLITDTILMTIVVYMQDGEQRFSSVKVYVFSSIFTLGIRIFDFGNTSPAV
jgi:hypothetical protein